jgi:hypothetical protein
VKVAIPSAEEVAVLTGDMYVIPSYVPATAPGRIEVSNTISETCAPETAAD